MKYMTGKRTYIFERDNSPSKYCIPGYYNEIDSSKLDFSEWLRMCLDMDPSIDMTYWEFDIRFSKELIDKYLKADDYFVQKKYIVTNRRIVHIFNNDPYFHASGFHKKPTNIVEFLKGIFLPDTIRFIKNRGGSTYELKNEKNKIKSFLNIQDEKYLKIQTSYLQEGFYLIENLSYAFSNNIDAFNDKILNESELHDMQNNYLLLEQLLFTFNPNVFSLGNTSDINENYASSIDIDEEVFPMLIKNLDFITEELGCDYLIEGLRLTLVSKMEKSA